MGLSALWSDDFHHQMRRILAGDADGYYVDYTDRVEDLQSRCFSAAGCTAASPRHFFRGPSEEQILMIRPEPFCVLHTEP